MRDPRFEELREITREWLQDLVEYGRDGHIYCGWCSPNKAVLSHREACIASRAMALIRDPQSPGLNAVLPIEA